MKIRNWFSRSNTYDINKESRKEERKVKKQYKDDGSKFMQYLAGICGKFNVTQSKLLLIVINNFNLYSKKENITEMEILKIRKSNHFLHALFIFLQSAKSVRKLELNRF